MTVVRTRPSVHVVRSISHTLPRKAGSLHGAPNGGAISGQSGVGVGIGIGVGVVPSGEGVDPPGIGVGPPGVGVYGAGVGVNLAGLQLSQQVVRQTTTFPVCSTPKPMYPFGLRSTHAVRPAQHATPSLPSGSIGAAY